MEWAKSLVWKPIHTAPPKGRFLIGGWTITGGGVFRFETVSYRDGNGTPIMTDDSYRAVVWAEVEPPAASHHDVVTRI